MLVVVDRQVRAHLYFQTRINRNVVQLDECVKTRTEQLNVTLLRSKRFDHFTVQYAYYFLCRPISMQQPAVLIPVEHCRLLG